MDLFTLSFLALGLAMDAAAAAASDGIAWPRSGRRLPVVTAALFGFFQGFMPLAGFLAGRRFSVFIHRVDYWVALALLSALGIDMIREAVDERRHPEHVPHPEPSLAFLLTQAVATSIDALAVGVSFALLSTSILPACLLIGAVTFLCSLAAFWLGRRAGELLRQQAQICGGVLLILIGLKIFLEHFL